MTRGLSSVLLCIAIAAGCGSSVIDGSDGGTIDLSSADGDGFRDPSAEDTGADGTVDGTDSGAELRTCGTPELFLGTEDEARNVLTGCQHFLGNMSFVFRPITTVDFMSEVQRIDGILDFRATPLLSLRGMESVRQINSLALQEMRIASLAPLEALMTASGLISLRDLLELASLQGLQSLEEVADLRIENVPSVSSLEDRKSVV